MGKTTFALNVVENTLRECDKPVLFFSMEMSARDITLKMLSSMAKVNYSHLRSGEMNDGDWAKLSASMAMLKEKEFHVIDRPALTPTELKHRARKFKRSHPDLGLIVVDYLQLMTVPSLTGNRNLEIGHISAALKTLAKELKIPVIALSQLNRSVDERRDKRPFMSDLRDSGSIEQDADVILFVYREEVYDKDNKDVKGLAEIVIGKQRNGAIGNINLTFRGEFSRFDNYCPKSFAMANHLSVV